MLFSRPLSHPRINPSPVYKWLYYKSLSVLIALIATTIQAHDGHDDLIHRHTPQPAPPLFSLSPATRISEQHYWDPKPIRAPTVRAATQATAPAPLPAIAQPFLSYAQKITTAGLTVKWSHDNLLVESNGLPAHGMMVGITNWQQQVPLPQNYRGRNLWQIPLKPVPATQPVTTAGSLRRGAIALAINGVPVFNALNNRGEDAKAIGELDKWGGHCGRADDYHYHVAPLHLNAIVGTGQPIAVALDGYAMYGLREPDGSPPGQLDALRGHTHGAPGYHYHASREYPYTVGGLRGQVQVSGDQIEPQPRTREIRPAGVPLAGASITAFVAVGPLKWELSFHKAGTLNGIRYGLEGDSYVFQFLGNSAAPRTERYSAVAAEPPRRPPAPALPVKLP